MIVPLCPCQGFPGPRLEGEETGPLFPGGRSLHTHRASCLHIQPLGTCTSQLRLHNKAAHMEWLKQQTFIPHSFGGWKSKIKVWAGLFLPRPLSLACRRPPSPCVLGGLPSGRVCVSISSYRDTSLPGATTGDPTPDKVMWKSHDKQGRSWLKGPPESARASTPKPESVCLTIL